MYFSSNPVKKHNIQHLHLKYLYVYASVLFPLYQQVRKLSKAETYKKYSKNHFFLSLFVSLDFARDFKPLEMITQYNSSISVIFVFDLYSSQIIGICLQYFQGLDPTLTSFSILNSCLLV